MTTEQGFAQQNNLLNAAQPINPPKIKEQELDTIIMAASGQFGHITWGDSVVRRLATQLRSMMRAIPSAPDHDPNEIGGTMHGTFTKQLDRQWQTSAGLDANVRMQQDQAILGGQAIGGQVCRPCGNCPYTFPDLPRGAK